MYELEYFEWSDFDCPLSPGSGERYMDRKVVLSLEDIIRTEEIHIKNYIRLAYTSKMRADQLSLATNDPHRAGLAVRIDTINNPRRVFKLVRGAMRFGFLQIAICTRKRYVHLGMDVMKDLYLTDWSH